MIGLSLTRLSARLVPALLVAVLLAGAGLVADPARAQDADASDLVIRLERLQNQMRQLTGQIEQLQYRNQQLEQQMKRMQDDNEFRFQQLGAKGGSPGGAPAAAPQGRPAPAASGRRSDALEPGQPSPGMGQGMGPIAADEPDTPIGAQAGAQAGVGAPIGAPGGRDAGAPLDLATMAGRAAAGGPPPPGGVPFQTAPAPTNAAPGMTAPPSNTPKDEYDLAYGYVLRKDYALAEQTFRDFVKKYPNDRQTAEAQYWLGESLFQRQRYQDAADSFLVVVRNHDKSAKAPDALLRLGQSLAAIGQKEMACASLNEVNRKYPRASASVKRGVEQEQKRARC